jgi:prefoldin subunit 5
MDRIEFKRELDRHKNQIDASIKYLQQGFEELNKRNYEFYEFIEANYFNLEERLTNLERKFKELS